MLGALQFSAPPSSVLIGAVIMRTPDGWHAGVLHLEGVEHKMLHLAWEGDLRNEGWHPPYAWLAPALHPIRARSIAALCRLVWRRNQKGGLPYGFAYRHSYFNGDGELTPGAGERGLTCATLVLAVFRSAGLELVDLSTWPDRDDDRAWQNSLAEKLLADVTDEAEKHRVITEIGAIRVRPSEAAGAMACRLHPAPFVEIRAEADCIEAQLSRH